MGEHGRLTGAARALMLAGSWAQAAGLIEDNLRGDDENQQGAAAVGREVGRWAGALGITLLEAQAARIAAG